MKPLYESILDVDFDGDDEAVKLEAARAVAIQAGYGKDDLDITFSENNTRMDIYWPSQQRREFIASDLIAGVKRSDINSITFEKRCTLTYLPDTISDMNIFGHDDIYMMPSFPFTKKVQLRNTNITSLTNLRFEHTNLILDRKSQLDSTRLALWFDSQITVKSRTNLKVNEIVIFKPARLYNLRLKRMGLFDLYKGDKDFSQYDAEQFSNINPAKSIFGIDYSGLYRIVVVSDMNGTGLVFIKNFMCSTASHILQSYKMDDGWACYICQNPIYETY